VKEIKAGVSWFSSELGYHFDVGPHSPGSDHAFKLIEVHPESSLLYNAAHNGSTQKTHLSQ